jgi:CRISPR-associated protein Cmr2
MSCLLALSVGPVQEFIAAARRTRDLWFGSYLLSEISKVAAKTVRDQGGILIFPAPINATDLEPDSKLNVANVILAEVPLGEPKEIAAKAKGAAQERWRGFAERARGEALSVIREEIWNDQVDDVIEFYAAWVTRSDDYQQDRGRVMRLLAGRKSCRDFLPAKGRAGVAKSSLDGQRESVLKAGDRTDWPKRLRLSKGEHLDVVGVVKRVAGGNRAYPSVARVAAETWLRGVKDAAGIRALSDACAVVPGLNKVGEPNYAYFPYEGTVIFKDRHAGLVDELGPGLEPQLKKVAEVLKEIGGEPHPYLAVLVADGDRMGAAIPALTSAKAHRDFSRTLAGFAEASQTIVNDRHGVLIYAGGDDVLAFLPVHTCLSCARALHHDFGERLKPRTLSVGIAIGHFMENLEDLLEYGRAAEKAAKKPDRDGLAVHLHKRGGTPIRVRAKWTDSPGPAEQWSRYAQLILADAIPSKLPYDLRKLADFYKGWPRQTEHEKQTIAEAMAKDTLRVIRAKQPRSGRQHMSEIERIVETIKMPDDLKQFTKQLLVARQISTALEQAGEGKS